MGVRGLLGIRVAGSRKFWPPLFEVKTKVEAIGGKEGEVGIRKSEGKGCVKYCDPAPDHPLASNLFPVTGVPNIPSRLAGPRSGGTFV